MTMYFRRKWELDLDDPRRWVPPANPTKRKFWERGLIMCSAPECFLHDLKEADKAQCTPSLHQQQHNYGRWLPRHIRDRAEGFDDTNVSHAHLSAHSDVVLSCSGCGVTHWRRYCPIRDCPQPQPDAGTDYSSKPL